jgi:hypothetical protein
MDKQVMLFLVALMLGFGARGGAQAQDNAQQQKHSTATNQDASQAGDQQPIQKEQTAADQKADNSAVQNADSSADDEDSRPAGRKTHFRLGAITLGASYTDFGRSFVAPFYPYYPYYAYYPYGAFSVAGFYTPFEGDLLYGPYYYPGRASDLNYGLGKGEVELESLGRNKNASVYIDQAYAGTAGKLKHMWLDSGAYNLSLTSADGSSFHQRIYVLSGKTLKIAPEFKTSANAAPNEEKK